MVKAEGLKRPTRIQLTQSEFIGDRIGGNSHPLVICGSLVVVGSDSSLASLRAAFTQDGCRRVSWSPRHCALPRK